MKMVGEGGASVSSTRDYVLLLVVEDDDQRVADSRVWFAHPRIRLLQVKTEDEALK